MVSFNVESLDHKITLILLALRLVPPKTLGPSILCKCPKAGLSHFTCAISKPEKGQTQWNLLNRVQTNGKDGFWVLTDFKRYIFVFNGLLDCIQQEGGGILNILNSFLLHYDIKLKWIQISIQLTWIKTAKMFTFFDTGILSMEPY